jgi:hypothetical protein
MGNALQQIIDLLQPIAALAKGTPLEQSETIQRCVDATEIALEALGKQKPAQEPKDIAELVEGMEVSIDVSTGDHDSGHRLFGSVTLVQENQGSKHGLILLVQDPEANFKAQPAAVQEPMSTMQPVVKIDGVSRFKANAIVQHLLDTHPTSDMNALACMNFTDEDRMQFAQLIGYSLVGYSELSYVSDASHDAAHLAAH